MQLTSKKRHVERSEAKSKHPAVIRLGEKHRLPFDKLRAGSPLRAFAAPVGMTFEEK